MMVTAQIGVRLDKKEKVEFENNAKAIGLSASAALKVLITKFNRDKGFSYPITAKDSIDTTGKLPENVEKAMLIAKGEELGLIEDTSKTVDNVEELRKRWTSK